MNSFRRNALRLALGATLATAMGAAPGVVCAQTAAPVSAYPGKPIRVVVPYPAGGGADFIGRSIGTQLGQAWGVPVVVENKPGASGITGNDIVAKSARDGHTVLIGITAMIQTPALYAKLPYDVVKDFAPVSQLALSADLFVVPREAPAKSLPEFVALAKSNPGKYNYGNYGNGTSSHMHGEQLKMKAGVDLVAVPYKGAAPLVNDVLGGQLASAFIDVSSANPYLKSDRFRILAITGTQRHPAVPDVPTFAELGYSGFEANGWFGAFVAAGTPKPIVDKLSVEIRRIVRSPELSGRLTAMGLRPVGGTPEELAGVMARDMPMWTRIVKDARISLD
jgi:tripartite-type tricarboxylate transporter receptor subunit TctC